MKTIEVILSDLIHASLQISEKETYEMKKCLNKKIRICFLCDEAYHFIVEDFAKRLCNQGFYCCVNSMVDFQANDLVFIIEAGQVHIPEEIFKLGIDVISISLYPKSKVSRISKKAIHLCQSQYDYDLLVKTKLSFQLYIMMVFESLMRIEENE